MYHYLACIEIKGQKGHHKAAVDSA